MITHFLRKLETALGIFCAIFVGLLVIVGILFAMMGNIKPTAPAPPGFVWMMPVTMIFVIVEGVFVCIVFDRLKRGWNPFIPKFAISLRPMPTWFRPFATAWSLAHFALGVLLAGMIESGLAAIGRYHSIAWIEILVFLIISFSLAYAFNLYAMLTLAAIGASERAIETAWRWRALIDLSIAAVAVTIGATLIGR